MLSSLKTGKDLKKIGLKNEEFTLNDNIILRKERVVIPTSLQEQILKELHIEHLRTVKMKNFARRLVEEYG